MSYRNDLDAAYARVESLERENHDLVAENARLRGAARALWMTQREVHPATGCGSSESSPSLPSWFQRP